MERELTLEFVRVTEAAALAAGRWMGRGDKEKADEAAVTAMRRMFDTVQINGIVVIGEGEMDEAPMLYIGERVGTGTPPEVDIAVDPLEGTNIVAKGLTGAISVLAAAPRGCLLHAPDMYMEKIAVGPRAAGKISIDAPVEENIKSVADALGKKPEDLTVVILDRPRHETLIQRVRKMGVRIQLIPDGDVAPAVAVGFEESGVDMLLGIGGAPEGVIAAAALRCLGGEMQARLWPVDDEDVERAREMGIEDLDRVLMMDDLVKTDDVVFAATGITDSSLLRGVHYTSWGARTHSVVIRGLTGTVRFIEASHFFSRKPEYARPC
ncbi:MAG: Fructose-1,6-bisphosphatase [Thermoanaerobacterales bacterium 50_218]|nr:MAG: Fructose-1,6-bisphosphatase [Thermoanaerobacterales bacterium 50_218]HAA89175.1 fructose-bisphosphatase class II [Peptococcaceae bacterium]